MPFPCTFRDLWPRPHAYIRSHARVACVALSITFAACAPATACVSGTAEILSRLPQQDEPHPFFFGKANYYDDEARTDALDALRLYWLARAGCLSQAGALAASVPDAEVYLAAAAMRRSGRVDEAGYSLLESRGREAMVLPLLVDPVNEPFMLRFARRPARPDETFRSPLEQVYHELHLRGQYERGVQLMDALGPFPGDDLLQQHRLAWALWRVGRQEEAARRWTPLLRDPELARLHANTLGAEGLWDEALALIDRSPAKERPAMLREYLEVTADYAGVRHRAGRLPACDRAWFAAIDRHYLLAMELADEGHCERLYRFVPPASSHRLAQRYSATGLYDVAALRGDGLLFRHLAGRAGVRDTYDYLVTSPVVLALVAAGRDDAAQQVLLEDGEVKRFRLWHWKDMARLAGDTFGFESWLDLALDRDTPSTDEPLMEWGQAFALHRPAQALRWYDSRRARMSAWQRKVLAFGMARGFAGVPLPRCTTVYRPVDPVYVIDPEARRPATVEERKAQSRNATRAAAQCRR